MKILKDIKCSQQLYEEDNIIIFILETAKLKSREAEETTLQRLQAVKPTPAHKGPDRMCALWTPTCAAFHMKALVLHGVRAKTDGRHGP